MINKSKTKYIRFSTTRPNLIKLSTKHPYEKGILNCKIKGEPFQSNSNISYDALFMCFWYKQSNICIIHCTDHP